ncbi:HIT domain-containing protein [Candidatus Woesebacteria bacterium]|nr:HIT domain-containing protein [Candidatus Woesebacteria bacterium]
MPSKKPASIFTKIINREIPATIRYEDDEFIAIDDIHPKAPVHVLLIPKEPFETLEHVEMSDGHFHKILLQTARRVAQLVGIGKNYKLIMNVGKDMQMVPHIHLHILGGWQIPPTDI